MANLFDNSFNLNVGLPKVASAPAVSKGSAVNSGQALPPVTPIGASLARTDLSAAQQEPVTKDVVMSAEKVNDAILRLKDYAQDTQRSLNFSLDEDSGITVISVYDAATKELIRQIPSEEAVTLAQKLNQEEPLLLFRAQV